MGNGYVPGSDWIAWGSGSTGWLYKYEMRGVQTEIIGGEVQMGYKGNTIDITSDFSFVRGKISQIMIILHLYRRIKLVY